ncbi:hypothetical protein [Nitrospira lenta]|uniref:Uncharacterized protein n=1 Tax=Nitrospira lenta TaxID=1436998 RepID=A0A330L8Y9_9BACT|nr:hypothetical protein [Nitrospira lenta]SPP65551.1 hypothetical protein NITLEN_40024 [Nitrospira lenta]
MLNTLISLTETGEFEDNGTIRFESAQGTQDGFLLDFGVNPGDETGEQRWRIRCSGVRDYRLHFEFTESIRVVSEHPILLPFVEQVTSLFFTGPAQNPLATVGALWECHRRLVGSWFPFERFLNLLPNGLSELLATSGGQLASGPVSVMKAYADVLTAHGVRLSMLPPRSLKYWNDGQWVIPNHTLHTLILESSYVVAETFDGERLGA